MPLLLLFLQEGPTAIPTPMPLRTQAQGPQLLPTLEVDGHPKADPLQKSARNLCIGLSGMMGKKMKKEEPKKVCRE